MIPEEAVMVSRYVDNLLAGFSFLNKQLDHIGMLLWPYMMTKMIYHITNEVDHVSIYLFQEIEQGNDLAVVTAKVKVRNE